MSRDVDNLTGIQRRIRAAATAAGLSLSALADAIPEYGMSTKRIASIGGAGEKDAKPTRERLQLIADECGCPVEWLERGWDAVSPNPPDADRIDQLEENVSFLMRQLARDPSSRRDQR